jgi:hypothetical protein
MFRIYNNNPAFGDGGPFEVEAETFEVARERLADEMELTFWSWAREAANDPDATPDNIYDWISERAAGMRAEFLRGLAEIRHCDLCGQDYHSDAPERGHADDCDEVQP